VRDGHADVVFANSVSGSGNLHPGFIGAGDTVLAGGVRELRLDGANLFFVIARAAGFAKAEIVAYSSRTYAILGTEIATVFVLKATA
jgi:hypothetical protein